MSSPNIIQELWNVPNPGDTGQVWDQLWGNAWHSSIIVSLGALIGGALMIYVVHRHRPVKAQSLFFAVLGCFLFIVGGTFNHFLLKDPPGHWALVIFYFCCQLFFNLGANATTFIVGCSSNPSEGFFVLTIDRYRPNNSLLNTAVLASVFQLQAANSVQSLYRSL